MSSYVYMKILESQPRRYDRGISWLSFGQSERVKRRIVNDHVTAGLRVLDIGCGTGTLAILAAQKGAQVTGFDISQGMLRVARGKIASEGLSGRVELAEMGIAGMERFADASFDLAAATLVFSELSRDERSYALHQAYRVLKPGGRLVVADEVTPERAWKRIVYALVRIPLLVVTFSITQTATRAVEGLEALAGQAGFTTETAQRSRLESFLYLVARKETA